MKLLLASQKYATLLSSNMISKDSMAFLIDLAGNSRRMVNGNEKKRQLEYSGTDHWAQSLPFYRHGFSLAYYRKFWGHAFKYI